MRPEAYIRSLFGPRDRVALVALPRGPNGGAVIQRVYAAEVASAGRTQAWLRHLNARRHDLFLSVNPMLEGARRRTRSSIGDVMRLFLDIDEDGERALSDILRDVNAGHLPPVTHLLRTSPAHYQVLWTLPRGTLSHEGAEALVRGLALRYGADPQVTDVARVLRLPGYRNWKRGGVPCVVVASTGRRARVEEFPPQLAVARPPRRTSPQAGRPPVAAAGGGDRSPSGRDWAWVREELRGGEPESALVERLALRRPDKPRPRAYAERTVARAAASLRRQGGTGS